jgi:hypothetical protein
MFDRGERRMARERMMAKAKRVWPKNHPGKYADNLKRCSCWMCGNIRKQEGMTIQERRFYAEPL